MLNLLTWWCAEGEEKQTLCNFNSYKFNKYFLLWYQTSVPNTELCIPAEISWIVWFNKNRDQADSKTRKFYGFHGGKSISKANWHSCFPAFAFWFLPDFSTAQSQLPVHCLMCFSIFWSTLAISSWKLPAWGCSWPMCLGWVPKWDFTIRASWLLNFTNTFFVDFKDFFLQILSSAGRWFDPQTRAGPRSTNM